MKKASLNLSINAIVILILAITMLGLGLSFMRTIFSSATQEFQEVSGTIHKQMIDQMKKGNKEIDLSNMIYDIEAGEKKQIYIGFKNKGNEQQNFTIRGVNVNSLSGDASNCDLDENENNVIIEYKQTPTLVHVGETVVLPINIKTNSNAEKDSCFYELLIDTEKETKTAISPTDNSLMAYWNLDDVSANDISGNNNNPPLPLTLHTKENTTSEGGTILLTCNPGTAITSYTSLYGENCANCNGGQSCGTCTLGSSSCSITYNNGNCGDCHTGCSKNGHLIINCEGDQLTSDGKYNSAFEFDGEEDYIEIEDNGKLDLIGEMTVSAWIYPMALPVGEGRTIISRYRWHPSTPSTGWNFGQTWGSYDYFDFVLYDGAGNSCSAGRGTLWADYLNQWVHLVGTFKASEYVRLYVNGDLVDEDTSDVVSTITYEYPLVVGARANMDQSHFDGTIDEVHIYNRSLSDDEVQQLFHAAYDSSIQLTVNIE